MAGLPDGFPPKGQDFPQQAERFDWSPRDYWVQPPTSLPIPTDPSRLLAVPAPEQFGFGESPVDRARLQANPVGFYPQPPFQPLPPPKNPNLMPPLPERLEWSVRDYWSFKDIFSVLGTPKLPPVVGPNPPQQNARPDWSAKDYQAFQPWIPALFGAIPKAAPLPQPLIVPPPEPPRDTTALAISIKTFVPIPPPPSTLWVPKGEDFGFGELPSELYAARLIIDNQPLVNPGIPTVPPAEAFLSFDYEPTEMTPYNLVAKVTLIPPKAGAQVPPERIPYLEPPTWDPRNYQSYQDSFSALRTPIPPVMPKGLRPTFTVEALIREEPRPATLQKYPVITKGTPALYPFALKYTPAKMFDPPPWRLSDYTPWQPTGATWIRPPPILPTIPDVIGDTQAVATTTLLSYGFTAVIAFGTSQTVPAGIVFNEVPPGGTKAPFFSPVTITVSLGSGIVIESTIPRAGRLIFNPKVASTTMILNPEFDFISVLEPSETISSATVTASVYTGYDSNPSAILSGAPIVSGTTVKQYVTGGVTGTIYGITCTIRTSLGETMTQSGFLAIDPVLV